MAVILPLPTSLSHSRLKSLTALADSGDEVTALRELEALRDQTEVDHPLWPDLLLALATLYPRMGRPSDAVRAALEALVWFQASDHPEPLCDAHTALAAAYALVGVGREALDHALQALELARALRDGRREAWALARTGNAHGALDNPVQAREATDMALTMARRLDLVDLELVCLNNQAYFTLDEYDRLHFDGMDGQLAALQGLAQRYAEEAVERSRAAGNPYMLAVALSNANEALLNAGELELAAVRIEELTQMAAQHRFAALQRFARLQHALLLCRRGQWSQGIGQAQRLLHDDSEHLVPRQRRVALQLLYEAHKALGDAATALAYLEQLLQNERRAARESQLQHTQMLMIRQEVHQAVRRAEYAAADADAARRETRVLQHEQRQLREQLADTDRVAREDALTELSNRRHAEEVLDVLATSERADSRAVGLALLDIDHFKRVNDVHGHAVGDAVIRRLAHVLRQQLREADVLARWGGEEFLLALSGISADGCERALQRVCDAVRHTDWTDLAQGLSVTVSIGCHFGPLAGAWSAPLEDADAALYEAKNGGRDRVVVRRP